MAEYSSVAVKETGSINRILLVASLFLLACAKTACSNMRQHWMFAGLTSPSWRLWSPDGRQPDVAVLKNTKPYKYRSPISRYLQHCTRNRAERDRQWDVQQMYADLKPSLDKFNQPFQTEPAAPARLATKSQDRSIRPVGRNSNSP